MVPHDGMCTQWTRPNWLPGKQAAHNGPSWRWRLMLGWVLSRNCTIISFCQNMCTSECRTHPYLHNVPSSCHHYFPLLQKIDTYTRILVRTMDVVVVLIDDTVIALRTNLNGQYQSLQGFLIVISPCESALHVSVDATRIEYNIGKTQPLSRLYSKWLALSPSITRTICLNFNQIICSTFFFTWGCSPIRLYRWWDVSTLHTGNYTS